MHLSAIKTINQKHCSGQGMNALPSLLLERLTSSFEYNGERMVSIMGYFIFTRASRKTFNYVDRGENIELRQASALRRASSFLFFLWSVAGRQRRLVAQMSVDVILLRQRQRSPMSAGRFLNCFKCHPLDGAVINKTNT